MILEIILLLVFISVIFWQGCLIFVAIQGAPTVYAWDEAILDTIKLAKPLKGETLLDLGCGNAKSLIMASKQFGLKGIGVEISPYCYLKSLWNVFISGESKNIRIVLGDLTKAKKCIRQADIVYLYLLNQVLEKIEPMLFENIKDDCRVVSLAFSFANKKPKAISATKNLRIETKNFLYVK